MTAPVSASASPAPASPSAQPSPLLDATLTVRSVDAAVRRYVDWLDFRLVEDGTLDAALAAAWQLPGTAGRRYAVLRCASGLASRYLSRPESRRLLMIGTGALAPHLVRVHAKVRPIREVAIWGRTRTIGIYCPATALPTGGFCSAPTTGISTTRWTAKCTLTTARCGASAWDRT